MPLGSPATMPTGNGISLVAQLLVQTTPRRGRQPGNKSAGWEAELDRQPERQERVLGNVASLLF